MPDWPHAPPHRALEPGTFMVTAATLHKALVFRSPERLSFLRDLLLRKLHEAGWCVQAWAVFPNHYHFVAYLPPGGNRDLSMILSDVHAESAILANREDNTPGRQVWFQFRDTAITIRSSYFARLRYVHENAVHHGIVPVAAQYNWCSAGWLEQKADPAYRKLLASFKTDRLNVYDEY